MDFDFEKYIEELKDSGALYTRIDDVIEGDIKEACYVSVIGKPECVVQFEVYTGVDGAKQAYRDRMSSGNIMLFQDSSYIRVDNVLIYVLSNEGSEKSVKVILEKIGDSTDYTYKANAKNSYTIKKTTLNVEQIV